MAYKYYCPCGQPIEAARWKAGYHYCKSPDCFSKYGIKQQPPIRHKNWRGREYEIETKPIVPESRPKARVKKVHKKVTVRRRIKKVEQEIACKICGNENANELSILGGDMIVCRGMNTCATSWAWVAG